ncbi:ABC transporter substrate-binding protein [Candidatus Dependentiae bacterium]|nr:ABC transporter substrate-binding protein [Candidatus Dependentiae bacterium]
MKKILIIFSLIFLFSKNLKSEIKIFNNLSSIENFYKNHPEYPKADNQNLIKPDYSTFQKQITPTKLQEFIDDIKRMIGLKTIVWDSDKFEDLLKNITEKNKKIYPKNKYILKITPKKQDNFIIWTELEGAFHSLVRGLIKLKKLEIIDDSLKIKQNNFFVFNGNILGRSPYILETLTIILKLMEKNPEQVFIIKGKYETKNRWLNFGLKKELKIKFKNPKLKKIPLESRLNEFLETQPLAIYINDLIIKDPGFIRISFFDRNHKALEEIYFSHFLQNQPIKKIDIFDLRQKIITNKIANIKAIIKGKKKINIYKKTDGLTAQIPDKGSVAWTSLSSPIKVNQELYGFKNDAFLILKIQKNKEPIITLYKQNANKKDGFKKVSYNIYSQYKLDKKGKIDKKTKIYKKTIKKEQITEKQIDTQKEITIGTSMDLSAELSEIARQVLKGLHLRISEQNRKGGVNNKKIKLIHLDDKYNQRIAKENIKLLTKLGIEILLSPVGSLTLKSIMPTINKNNMLVLFPEATSPIFRGAKNIIHLLASSDKEGKALINYLLKEYSPSKIALFYQPEPFSLGALNAIKLQLKKANLIENKDWIATYHLPNSLNVSNAVKKIKSFNPEAIILLTTSLAVQNLIKELSMEFLFNKQILGISSCSGVAFKTFLRNKNLKYINTQLIPDPQKSILELVTEFQNEANKAGEPLGGFILEGYMIADIFIHIIKQIKGKITKEKIVRVIENIKNENYKGIPLNFNQKTQEISNTVWLDTGKQVVMITN